MNNKWISVNDELPEEFEYCIVYFNSNIEHLQYVGAGCFSNHDDMYDDITHWIPLPPPPEL